MNDFTKEELKIIADSLFYFLSTRRAYTKESIIIQNKIQSMIENYCEHESNISCIHKTDSITISGIIQICEGDINTPFKCNKCGEYYDNK